MANILADAVRKDLSLTNRTRSKNLPQLPPRVEAEVGENVLLNVDVLKVVILISVPPTPIISRLWLAALT